MRKSKTLKVMEICSANICINKTFSCSLCICSLSFVPILLEINKFINILNIIVYTNCTLVPDTKLCGVLISLCTGGQIFLDNVSVLLTCAGG